ncbi:ABC transporter permease [Geomonas azotofigens]|uniref:ABC transporter permease n=1 Tax=Geomonas azotofigens TaxID=2843196 RepID=UPI001C11EED8|nr:ABC transporter permease subunit [Geomonas azotofigens]MBU5613246.1 ABC transporter permease subunit [Geomonas azotofigens]
MEAVLSAGARVERVSIAKRLILSPASIVFVLLLAELFWPVPGEEYPAYLLALTAAVELAYLVRVSLGRGGKGLAGAGDVAAIVFGILLAWHLCTTRFVLLDKMLFPKPEPVLRLFVSELPDMLKGLVNSLILLVSGYLIALATAIPLGLLVGWRVRLFNALHPFTKVLGPIPPIVYIPYAIALLPSFRAASIFVIFIGAFWPVFINTVNGVFNIHKGLLDSARVLSLSERTLLFRVILPGAMPSICTGATLGLVFALVLLTAAELIGANSGIGWYVKNFADFADYQRVVVGIIFISIVVTVITWGTERLERRLLRWRN